LPSTSITARVTTIPSPPLVTLASRLRQLESLAVALISAALAAAAGCGDGGDGRSGVDLTVDRDAIVASLALDSRSFAPDDCSVAEGSVGAPGVRRLLRFDAIVVNRGTRALVLGDPAHPLPPFTADDFEFSPCHHHFHFRDFADYELRGPAGAVAFGHKQAFCIRDSLPYGPEPSGGYDCDFQGLSPGWGDDYPAALDGQWVDVTGVPAGDYEVVVTVNPAGRIREHGDAPNVVTVPVHLPD
jgi:hypothetical protein